MTETLSASHAVRILCRAGLAYDYAEGMALLKDHAVWARCNMVTWPSVQDILNTAN